MSVGFDDAIALSNGTESAAIVLSVISPDKGVILTVFAVGRVSARVTHTASSTATKTAHFVQRLLRLPTVEIIAFSPMLTAVVLTATVSFFFS